jgi:hypothetical protein
MWIGCWASDMPTRYASHRYGDGVLALTLGQAKTLAIVIVLVLVVGAIASFFVAKQITQKIVAGVIFGLLAVLVWTQRASLDECADKVKAGGLRGDTTCSFFGREIEIAGDR